ncbi:MAG TPA: hypothetical protein VLT62_19340 [Candidatus Methylomirabilis sp.]|nr:hypothetical protein [Candidatus Methylomirabilis sp.]
MRSCADLRQRVGELATLRAGELPELVRRHLAGCPPCSALLARERLVRGLLTAGVEGCEPPPGFAEKVLASLPRAVAPWRPEADLWRPAWGLVPAFAATAAALLILVQSSAIPDPMGLLPTETLTAGESFVLESPPQGLDLVLTAVLDRDEP